MPNWRPFWGPMSAPQKEDSSVKELTTCHGGNRRALSNNESPGRSVQRSAFVFVVNRDVPQNFDGRAAG